MKMASRFIHQASQCLSSGLLRLWPRLSITSWTNTHYAFWLMTLAYVVASLGTMVRT